MKHLKSYQEYYGKLGSAIGTVVSHYTSAGKEFKKIDKDVLRITDKSLGYEQLILEKPEREETE